MLTNNIFYFLLHVSIYSSFQIISSCTFHHSFAKQNFEMYRVIVVESRNFVCHCEILKWDLRFVATDFVAREGSTCLR
jgi:hypothetical protein